MEMHTRKISKEIYDRAIKNKGRIELKDGMKLFEDYEIAGYNVHSEIVIEKPDGFYAMYLVDKIFE